MAVGFPLRRLGLPPERLAVTTSSGLTPDWAWAVAALSVVLSGVSAFLALEGAERNRGLVATGCVLLVAVPFAVGIYAAQRESSARFGRVLLVAALASFLATLSQSQNALLYSLGHISYWLLEVMIAFLILSFPSGRLEARGDRVLVMIAGVAVLILYLPTALLVHQFPLPAPYSSCTSTCPHNSFFVLSSEPTFVKNLVIPVRELLTIALFSVITGRLIWRVRHSTRLLRRTLSPVLAVAAVRAAVVAVAVALRRVDPGSTQVTAMVWVLALAFPALAVGFLIGLLRWQLYVASALQKLAIALLGAPDAEELRMALADSFDDPTLALTFPSADGAGLWIGLDGRPVGRPEPNSGLSFTEVIEDGRAVAGIVHDAALKSHQPFTRAVAGYTLIALQNQRLSGEVEASLREVSASRSRILAAADGERRRIERDLHDGAQQRLVALRMRLELAEDAIDEAPGQARARLRTLADELAAALEEIRNLARGVYPPLLASEGLAAALRSAALRTPISATVTATDVGRYSQELESAVYFCCLEALQNASKYAAGATTLEIFLAADEFTLSVEVRDDGAGFDPAQVAAGTGLTNMSDRLAAVGGQLNVDSAPGRGTCVSGRIPLRSGGWSTSQPTWP